VAEGAKEYACPATTPVLGVPAIVRLPEEAVGVDKTLLVWEVEFGEPAALTVSVVAADEGESEDTPQPATIPQTDTSAQHSVPRQDFRLTICEPPNWTEQGRSSEVCQ
jgi:hypothetical protein